MSGSRAGWIAALPLGAVGGGLAFTVLALPQPHPGLRDAVLARLAASGVDSPVTAVLLNFRGYDTFLEIAVLTVAVVGIWSMGPTPVESGDPPGPVLELLVQVLVPFMLLLGAYLVWAGSHQAGGAFQGGAVFAAALVLMLLGGAPLPEWLGRWPLRVLLTFGLLAFAAAGLGVMLAGHRFLEWPERWAGLLILAVEMAAAISIGTILAAALRGGRPEPR